VARRPVWVEVDLAAITHNCAALTARVAPARLCAVVKAFGYGHGPVRVAEAAVAGGASWLAVATVEEGVALRQAGLSEPVLLLSEPPPPAMPDVLAWRLSPTIYSADGLEAAAKAVAGFGHSGAIGVHVKADTGMHRVGADPDVAFALAMAAHDRPELALEGLCTHFAVADEPADPYTAEQLTCFEGLVERLARAGVRAELCHAANSAAALVHPETRLDMVRCGLAVYGLAPSPELAGCCRDLRPALSFKARVGFVKEVAAGERLSYGRRYGLTRRSVIATVPVGYADGVPRRLFDGGGEVLIGGRRRPIAGAVTMDQITVDCGDDHGVSVGDEVVLIGTQGAESIGAWEWAARLDTIAYEVTCGISARVPRVYVP